MVTKAKKSQLLIVRFFYIGMVLIMLFFAYKLLSPLMPEFLSGKSLELQMLIFLIMPLIFFFFLIYIFKTFKKGENE